MALIQCNFFSKALMRTVPIQVVLPTDKFVGPEGAMPEGPFKTLYLLHGIMGNYTDWVSGTRVQSWAQDRNLAVVMPSGDNSFYVDNPKSGANYATFIGKELVDFTRRSFPLSHKREDTFIGGLSMGGFGTWAMGIHYPRFFSAIAPVCGGGLSWRCPNLKEVPVWAFHGARDSTVPLRNSIEMVDAVNRAGGNARLTIFHTVEHNSWDEAYGTTTVLDWLLEQKRNSPDRFKGDTQ